MCESANYDTSSIAIWQHALFVFELILQHQSEIVAFNLLLNEVNN